MVKTTTTTNRDHDNINDDGDDDIIQDGDKNNIKLLSSFKRTFERLTEHQIKDCHLFLDSCFYHSINTTIGLNNIILKSKSCNLLQTTLNHSSLNKLILTFNKDEEWKVVFFISGYIWDYAESIKLILERYDWCKSLIFCSMSEIAHVTHPQPPITLSRVLQQSPSIYDHFNTQFHSLLTDVNPDALSSINYFTCNFSVPLNGANLFTIPLQHGFLPPLYFNDYLLQQQQQQTQQQYSQQSQQQQQYSQQQQEQQIISKIKLNKLPFDMQEDVHKTIHSLLSFVSDQKLGSVTGEDLSVYPLGQFSQFIASEIHSTLTTANKVQTEDYHPISLVLVDRYLDLVGPCSHSENALDRIFNTISTTSKSSSSPSINIAPVFVNNQNGQFNGMVNGDMNGKENGFWSSLQSKTLREAVTILKRKVVDIIAQENINLDVSTLTSSSNAMSVQSLQTMLSVISATPRLSLRYSDTIQAICSIIQTLQCSQHLHWDNLLSIERILLLSAGSYDDNQDDEDDEEDEDQEQSLLSQIIDFINSPVSSLDKSYYSISEILNLCIFAFSLIGDKSFSEEDIDSLVDSLSERIEASKKEIEIDGDNNNEILKLLLDDIKEKESLSKKSQVDSDDDDENESDSDSSDSSETNNNNNDATRNKVNEILNVLLQLGSSRKTLKEFKNLVSGGMTGSTYQPLLVNLCKAIIGQQGTGENKDLERFNEESSKLGSLFGGWTRRTKKIHKVSDNRKIIVYVMGGITLQELKDCQDVIDKSTKQSTSPFYNHQIIFGSSHISTSNNILQSYLLDSIK
ncbi:Sec1-like family protein [Cavenderia fasciculata]|uniref:Sec1-like family protein n=1 Tax=Cavenderia fasciculata TaxID=261658 RepID=F4Q8I1_CACFS|nr:Sec1-like family protein [Cavenderia fasciculata]EGG16081.1 Sec1-like family protein [Cavenderia fasciculata]|eukprot:XP_004352406.1 Sec1-like family protein [Cavenderia fasciculata]